MDNFEKIGAIVPQVISNTRSALPHEKKAPIVHCGGLCSPAMFQGADKVFVDYLLQTLAALKSPFRLVLPRHLHETYVNRLPPDVSTIDCSPLTVGEHIEGSSFSVTTSGIEFTYESLLLGSPAVFLPPFNASQYLQLQYHQAAHDQWVPFRLDRPKTGLDFASLHEATAAVQDAGIHGLWGEQFAQVRQFLESAHQDESTQILESIRLDQAHVIRQLGSDGAHVVASYAARELQGERALQ